MLLDQQAQLSMSTFIMMASLRRDLPAAPPLILD